MLQQHESEHIYGIAFKIIEEFFSDDGDSDLALGTEGMEQHTQGGHFNF